MAKFRFQDLEIWRIAIEIADGLFEISDELEEKKLFRDEDWNDMTISAKAGDVTVHVNGVKTAELRDDPSRPEGHFALQMHSGTVMLVMFKDIEVLEQ